MKTIDIHLAHVWHSSGGIGSVLTRMSAVLTALALLLGLNSAFAADDKPPSGISYQGFLSDANGDSLADTAPTNYEIKFRIYDAEENGNILWSESQTVTVDNGSFSVMLGEGTEISGEESKNTDIASVFDATDASDRYVELTVASGAAIAPRLRLVTSPYSFLATKAITADKLSSGSTDAITFNGSDKVTVGQKLDVAGATTIGADLGVTGALTATGMISGASFSGTGDVTVGGAVSATSFSGTGDVTVGGAVSATSFSGTGDVTVGGAVSATSFSGNGTIPIGGIIMWSGSTSSIPAGWKICDGNNGTPNLEDRFVVGAGNSYSVGDKDGSTTVTLTESNLPSFDEISYQDIFYSEHKDTVNRTDVGEVRVPGNVGSHGGVDTDNWGFEFTRDTASYSGQSQAFSVLPPYYALAYIMRVD
jgi:microcystin-dependent protein